MLDFPLKGELGTVGQRQSSGNPITNRIFSLSRVKDTRKQCALLSSFVLGAMILNALSANGAAAAGGEASSEPPLTTDPIAQVPWLSVGDWYSPDFHGAAGSSNSITARLLLPFETGPLNHVLRTTIPFNVKAPPAEAQNDTSENISDLPLGAGNLGDITVYDLLVFPLLDGRRGSGP